MLRDLFESRGVSFPGVECAAVADFFPLNCSIYFQQPQGLIQRAPAVVQFRAKLGHTQRAGLLEDAEHAFHYFQRGKSRIDEVILDFVVFASIQENAISRIYRTARAAYL